MSFLETLTDLKTYPDLTFDLQGPEDALIEDALWILLTERGALWYDLEYGLGIGQYLNAAVTPELLEEIAVRAANALERDPRILRAECSVGQPAPNTLDVAVSATTRDGDLEFVARLDQTSTEVIYRNTR